MFSIAFCEFWRGLVKCVLFLFLNVAGPLYIFSRSLIGFLVLIIFGVFVVVSCCKCLLVGVCGLLVGFVRFQ